MKRILKPAVVLPKSIISKPSVVLGVSPVALVENAVSDVTGMGLVGDVVDEFSDGPVVGCPVAAETVVIVVAGSVIVNVVVDDEVVVDEVTASDVEEPEVVEFALPSVGVAVTPSGGFVKSTISK